jgi:hypothetical protein
LTSVKVEPMTADLSTDEGVDAIAAVYAGTAATGRGCSAGTRRFAWQPADDYPAGSLGPVTNGAERTRWKIRSDRLVDETPQVRLSIASLELASGLTFEQ